MLHASPKVEPGHIKPKTKFHVTLTQHINFTQKMTNLIKSINLKGYVVFSTITLLQRNVTLYINV